MRLRKIKNAAEKLLDFSDLVVLNPQNYYGRWNEIFNNNNQICLEIGMGKGKFIKTNSENNQELNYIGLEKSDSIILKAARDIKKLNLKNLKLLNYNASGLRGIFSDNSISKIFLNFSDPWPKLRHEKRRLTSADFLNIYKSILTEKGIIELKTDNRNLFEYSLIQLNKAKFNFLDINLNLHEFDNDIITTEYEDKFKILNKIIYYVKVEK